jgi:hypothetical protein
MRRRRAHLRPLQSKQKTPTPGSHSGGVSGDAAEAIADAHCDTA